MVLLDVLQEGGILRGRTVGKFHFYQNTGLAKITVCELRIYLELMGNGCVV